MSDFRFLAVQYLRAQTLSQITDLTRRSYKGYTRDEREALILIARVVARELLEKRKAERVEKVQNEASKADA